jgi:hypothetical protein
MAKSNRIVLRSVCGLFIAAALTSMPQLSPTATRPIRPWPGIRPEAIRADIRFLSDDLLEGRPTATRGDQIAAKFMASPFEGLGFQPAGDAGTYFQNVPLRSMRVDQALRLTRDGKTETLAFGKDFVAFADPGRSESSVEGLVVHQPQDDIDQSGLDFAAATQFARFLPSCAAT